jgi:hypothetical protein
MANTPNMAPGKLKALSLEDILIALGPITSVSFSPFKPETKQEAKALLPPSFLPNPHPFDYFTLFFTPDLCRTITRNTNQYASTKRIHIVEERAREWKELQVEEFYVFLGTIIYMGIHEEPQIEMYWNTDFNKGPLHSVQNHISLCRFEQIKRYCHISCSESDQRKGYYASSNKIWWYKVEPLASSIQASSQRYYSPSSEVSINELKRPKQGTCAWCSYQLKREKLLNKGVKGVAKRSVGGCFFCEVPLCREGDCWTQFHTIDVDY